MMTEKQRETYMLLCMTGREHEATEFRDKCEREAAERKNAEKKEEQNESET